MSRTIDWRELSETTKPVTVTGPAFVDLQCNGYAGVDFNNPNATVQQLVTGILAMRAHGCRYVLPTLVTQAPDRLEHLFRQLVATRESDARVQRMVPGFHLEGPFISGVEGARGAHPQEWVCAADRRLWKRWQKTAGGLIRMVTVAPEVRGAVAFIRQLRSEGVVPALGHTMATRQEVAAAAEAGALVSTHLGNGCPQLLHRHENPMQAQLAEDRLAATLITDGIHLPPGVVQSFTRAKGLARTLVVTDAMAAAGAGPGRYRLADLELEVGGDRVVRLPGGQNFAGSALTMDEAVANFRCMAGLTWREAWEAGSTRAWTLLRQADPKLRAGRETIQVRLEGDRLTVLPTAER